ncbi:ribbon-helix-helix domain-containing protein [Granulicella tundricola]|uniref:Putative plasmid stabilization protein n=1 Tax=Granulicella tundricola (strain ATCC BAA-1859 / DSM 23138 / MP5ACTX9) TaxID=1198114 RepID=E8X4T1_GRATM|nr:plasmid stabilization protein [Granulicella tundricola]ADW70570.1 putative plasmid stabilization protein [Granulicella tundricola MP5ACTX9]
MPEPSVLHITLSEETLEFVRSKVASGKYQSESDVVTDCLDVFRQDEEEHKRFEQEVVGPAYDELKANPSHSISIEEVERSLEARRQARQLANQ